LSPVMNRGSPEGDDQDGKPNLSIIHRTGDASTPHRPPVPGILGFETGGKMWPYVGGWGMGAPSAPAGSWLSIPLVSSVTRRD
jgi:hypothetical protein